MNNYTKTVSHAKSYDVGLREYMIGVYNNMLIALGITGATSYLTITSGIIGLFFDQNGMSGLGYLALFAPLVFVMFLGFKIRTMEPAKARMMLWVYAGLMGLSLAPIFLAYTGASIARVFFITASVFGAMSIYGYTTKRDLTGMGSFLFMGLIGIVIASLVNLFMQSSALYFVVSVVGVLVFTGLTAYDVQKISQMYHHAPSAKDRARYSVVGALSLYLDFINLFLMLLRLFGNRR
ncbi:MAG: Bax inhibitor-1/YccA family protein [Rickettsiales bacterium]